MDEESIQKVLKTLMEYKTEREVDDHNETYGFRNGYVKAMNDAFNLIKRTNELSPSLKQNELLIALLIENIGKFVPEDNFVKLSNSYKKLKKIYN